MSQKRKVFGCLGVAVGLLALFLALAAGALWVAGTEDVPKEALIFNVVLFGGLAVGAGFFARRMFLGPKQAGPAAPKPKPSAATPWVWVGRAVLIFGVFMLVFGAFEYRKARSFAQGATRVTGTVVGVERGPARRSAGYPIVEFKLATGTSLRFRSANPAGIPMKAGDVLGVLYDPATCRPSGCEPPDAVRVDSFATLWLPSVVGILIGGAGAVFGLAILAIVRFRSPRPAPEP